MFRTKFCDGVYMSDKVQINEVMFRNWCQICVMI